MIVTNKLSIDINKIGNYFLVTKKSVIFLYYRRLFKKSSYLWVSDTLAPDWFEYHGKTVLNFSGKINTKIKQIQTSLQPRDSSNTMSYPTKSIEPFMLWRKF